MRLDKNSLVKEAARPESRMQNSSLGAFCEPQPSCQRIPPADRYPVSISYPSGKRNFQMENANGRDNESPSIPIACSYNEPVTLSLLSRSGKGGKRRQIKREREREREADMLLLSNYYPIYTSAILVASMPTNGRVPALTPRKLLSHDPAFPWLAWFHASSFVSLEYVGICFIYFLFSRGFSLA